MKGALPGRFQIILQHDGVIVAELLGAKEKRSVSVSSFAMSSFRAASLFLSSSRYLRRNSAHFSISLAASAIELHSLTSTPGIRFLRFRCSSEGKYFRRNLNSSANADRYSIILNPATGPVRTRHKGEGQVMRKITVDPGA